MFGVFVEHFAQVHHQFHERGTLLATNLSADQIDILAKLPTRDQAIALLMAVMQAPITKLTRTLNDVPAKVTRVVAAVRDQKQEAAA